jgi:phage-related minor tail protein
MNPEKIIILVQNLADYANESINNLIIENIKESIDYNSIVSLHLTVIVYMAKRQISNIIKSAIKDKEKNLISLLDVVKTSFDMMGKQLLKEFEVNKDDAKV